MNKKGYKDCKDCEYCKTHGQCYRDYFKNKRQSAK